jgi:hypothetical protein
MGARFRLKQINMAARNFTPEFQRFCRAMQTYGCILGDTTGARDLQNGDMYFQGIYDPRWNSYFATHPTLGWAGSWMGQGQRLFTDDFEIITLGYRP